MAEKYICPVCGNSNFWIPPNQPTTAVQWQCLKCGSRAYPTIIYYPDTYMANGCIVSLPGCALESRQACDKAPSA